MASKSNRLIVILGIVLGLTLPAQTVLAQSESFRQLTAEWWQWALSVPTPSNPLLKLIDLEAIALVVFGGGDWEDTLQPVDPARWTGKPWEPVLRDGPVESGGRDVPWPLPSASSSPKLFLYARSASDDKAPIVALPGDRYVIRSYSPIVTIGGGTVLDVAPPRFKRKSGALADHLRVLETAPPAKVVATPASTRAQLRAFHAQRLTPYAQNVTAVRTKSAETFAVRSS